MEETSSYGRYLFRPLEPGYGITIGNALRRVLLSSIEGYAIATLKIPGVLHEFSAIEGVIEDVVDIILNLKQVALRPKVEEAPDRIFIEIRQKEVFTAGDLAEQAPAYEVANPDLVLMNLDPSAIVQMELGIAKGRGYRLAEENKALLRGKIDLNEIVLDTSFSPVVRVVPRVETILYRERADYEQLVLEIQTKGNVTPREALQSATQILVEHFVRLLGPNGAPPVVGSPKATKGISEEMLRLLLKPIEEVELGLAAGAYSSLRNAGITRLIDLVALQPKDLEYYRGVGRESIERLQAYLARLNLRLGMDVSAYKALLSK
ncbi:MAG: DNA-directed RNA polymerase subunit alpha [Bacteroidia bacterium]|nr:DNA-directed RNA polymerase subunit alpha [Bacteroidia bacterium]MDW8014890.1 DNA-directed RNA polymerase subunit alpha [Bacteroidia bacterium]